MIIESGSKEKNESSTDLKKREDSEWRQTA